ncbi:hypothetical protein CRYUN_Cryun11dG0122100 [Craigia yunnanensis]
MVLNPVKRQKKGQYDQKLCRLLDECSQILIVAADNVGSTQMQSIRQGLRGDSIVLVGKNTMMKRSIRLHADNTNNNAIRNLIPLLVGNVGLIFTKGDLKEVREEIAKYKAGAPARVGLVAPINVVVPPGNTGLDPSQTSFFQVLNIPTKINKDTVEIITAVDLIKKVFSPEVLNLTEGDLLVKFANGVSMVASFSLAISFPTLAAAPHMFVNAYKNALFVAVASDYSFPQAEKVKEFLKDPSKFAVAAAAPASGAANKEKVEQCEEAKEVEEESEEDLVAGLFD